MEKAIITRQGKGWLISLDNGKKLTCNWKNLPDDIDGKQITIVRKNGAPFKITCEEREFMQPAKPAGSNFANNDRSFKKGRSSSIVKKPYGKQFGTSERNVERRRDDPARAPYNFVPLNHKIVVPKNEASFINFKDLSGNIRIIITTKGPLFIRGNKESFINLKNNPFVPGTSLRGMIRNIVTMVSYGKMNQFQDKTLFRRSNLTQDGEKVFAGFLLCKNGKYYINKAKAAQSQGYSKLSQSPHNYKFNYDSNACEFSVGEFQHRCRVWVFTKSVGNIEVDSAAINAYESDDSRSDSAIDLVKSLKNKKVVNANNQSIGDVSIREDLGIPVFYREVNGRIISIGHAKRHRIPYEKSIKDHVIQDNVSSNDFAENIFGTFKESSKAFFSDCFLKNFADSNKLFELKKAERPKILSSPKPTTFQHYLKQPSLDSSSSRQNKWSDDNIPIRGYKNYWHKTISSDKKNSNTTWIETGEITKSHPDPINPITKDHEFEGVIRFENLSSEELGALLFALDLPADCYHKLGMGKPLGLGSVHIGIEKLTIIERKNRYSKLFNDHNQWQTGEADITDEIAKRKRHFEDYMLGQLKDAEEIRKEIKCLWDVDRLKELKTLLTFEHSMDGANVNWHERTRYMDIDHPDGNEYKHRPILPEPSEVIQKDMYKKK